MISAPNDQREGAVRSSAGLVVVDSSSEGLGQGMAPHRQMH